MGGDALLKRLALSGLIICISALILSGCSQHTGSTGTTPEYDSISILDEEGRTVDVPADPASIVCLVPAVAEVIYALDEGNRIVACSYECNFPQDLKTKTNVGAASKPNIELVLKQKPDLVIARTGTLFKQELRDKLEFAGVPVIQFRSLELDTALQMTGQMGLLLDRQEKADQLSEYILHYENLITERTATLDSGQKPLVLFQSMGHMYWSNNADTAGHRRIAAAGGTNIAADEPVHVPHLSAEWVYEKNPDVTVYSYLDASDAGKIPALEELKSVYDMMIAQPGFSEITAVKEGNVHIIDSRLLTGPRSIIGLLYYATWYHPDLFTDIDPETVHREMLQTFWDQKLEGCWVYPAP